MKTILIATDFSPAALNAAEYAADMAVAIHADLLLLHIYQVPFVYSDVPIPVNEEEIRKGVQKQVDDQKEQLKQKVNGRLNIRAAVTMGTFFQELESACEYVKPYAVVMGSQGTTAAERFLFGGHAVYTMKNLMWPVITVPAGSVFSSIKKIGLACNFDDVASTIPVDEIKLLAADFKAELHVLNTGKEDVFDPNAIFESGLLKQMLEDFHPEYHFISSENTDEAIIDFAENNDIDLLLVFPGRHTLMDKMIHRSHTKQFVLHCHVPVMALHQ